MCLTESLRGGALSPSPTPSTQLACGVLVNVVFLSPFFPPTAPSFCKALAQRGVTVLGIGDDPVDNTAVDAGGLTAYVCEPAMADYAALRRVFVELQERYGEIDRVDSNGERWLSEEARLRDDFGVPGPSLVRVTEQRSKLGMARLFEKAGLAHPAGLAAGNVEIVRQFAARHGFPLVFKPDHGSGATDTFRVSGSAELDHALQRDLSGHLVQPFIAGDIVTYDGLTDAQGHIVFDTSHVYDTGIMQIREGELDGHYYSLRDVPEDLERCGRAAVAAFDIRERFFHLEMFRRPDGHLMALEMNIRPPGGFTTDMMNVACEFDVYDLWARALVGEDLRGFAFQRRYHTAHAGRRHARRYRLTEPELERELGDVLIDRRPISHHFADTMGDVMYLLRHPELEQLQHAIALVQAR